LRGKALARTMLCAAGVVLVAVPAAAAQDPEPAAVGGMQFGVEPVLPQPTVPGAVVQLVDGVAHAPEAAPEPVKQAIWAANRIIGLPYKYGGGHRLGFEDDGYDCSGTVSYALRGGALLARPRDSSSFLRWGASGAGDWITVYTNPGHAYAVIAGLRLDTSAAGDPSGAKGPRWRPAPRSTRGYRARHPIGL